MRNGRVAASVQAGMSPSRPSRASIRLPEHCAPMVWRTGSSCSRSSSEPPLPMSSTIARVNRPLPNTTASASLANSSGCWACTTTPFIDVTLAVGAAISAFQPCADKRLRRPSDRNESISLKPSKVTIAMRMVVTS